MSILDEIAVTPEQVATTAGAVVASVEAIAALAEENEKLVEVKPVTPAERIKQQFGSLVPRQIDHTNCDHEPTDNERRRCRKERINAASANGEKGALILEQDGTTYVSADLARAVVIDQYRRGNIRQTRMNYMLSQMKLPESAVNRDGLTKTIDVTLDLKSSDDMPRDWRGEPGRARMCRLFRDWYPALVMTAEQEPRQVVQTYVTYDDDVEASREDKQLNILTVRITGDYLFGADTDIKAQVVVIEQFVNSWARNYWNVDTVKIVQHNLDDNDAAKEDNDLVTAYREMVAAA